MRPLYQITDSLSALLMTTEDGDLPPGLEEQLDALECELEAKVEGCCCAIRNLEAEEKALKEEAQRFARRAQVAGNQVSRLKDYLKVNLEKLAIPKLDAGLFKVRLQRNGIPTVEFVGDPGKLPEEFQRVKVELNNDAAREAWKAGQELPEGVSVVQGSHVRIN